MKVKLEGFRKLDFESKGEQVKGMQIFVTYKDDAVTGTMADKIFVKNEDLITIDLRQFIGKDIEIDFGFKGKVTSISAI